MKRQILNSKSIANLMYMPKIEEPTARFTNSICGSAIFIGNSYTYSMPILVNFDKLLNPHVLTIGMTGSGKTFLMKSLIMRLSVLEGSRIILIDFTGEYQKSLDLQSVDISETDPEQYNENEIIYFNLANIPEAQKISISSEILQKSVSLMRKQEINPNKRIFIVLDEAWKLLNKEVSLETIIREGRKYGIGLILSSQLVDDADSTILSNIATLFLFRTQNKKSLERIAKNYNLAENQISKVQDLELGSCLAIQVYKSDQRSAFIVRKVIGLNFNDMIKIKIGNQMGIDVSSGDFEKLLSKLCGEKSAGIAKLVKERGEIPLNELFTELILCGADRRAILLEFRRLGFDDQVLADSFSYTVYELGANK